MISEKPQLDFLDLSPAAIAYLNSILSGSGIGGNTGATDNALLRADGTGGATLQNSPAAISDTGVLTGVTEIQAPAANTLLNTAGNNFYINSNGSIATIAYYNRMLLFSFSFYSQSPAQFTANQDNLSVNRPSGSVLRLSSDASRDLTGIAESGYGNQEGDWWLLINVGAQNIVLKHESANSTATNRFLNSTGADITLLPNQAADAHYDTVTARFRVFKRN